MKESEPANPKEPQHERHTTSIQGSATAAEIRGYADIGMKKEALRAVRTVLAKRRIRPEEFAEAHRAIGVFSNFDKWKCKLEDTYNRQSRRFKRAMRPYMVELYGSLGEWEAALQFLSVREPSTATEMYFGMESLLELDKLQDAKTLAVECSKAFESATDAFEQSLLLTALARYYSRIRRWYDSTNAWEHMPLEQPFRRDALSGIVKIHLARALRAIYRGLQALSELKKKADNENQLSLPGNDLALTARAEKELLKFQRGIERLLPGNARKNLGIDIGQS
ncbi:MAG: hypothetical protein DME75_05345 [Verrucomicrobia bacterium]|nr:MAG: hypothetical protein DME75_05345 [Verrucomicrobiota bacterium]